MTVRPPPGAVGLSSSDGLGRRAASGGVVMMGGQLLRILIQMVSLIILARLLTPRDYGLVAMVMAVIAFADIFRDLGLSAAAVQAPVLTRAQQYNLFWINSAIGTFLAVTAFAAAPLVANLYDEPALVGLTRALAFTFVINGMATQFRADLNRRLSFRKLVGSDVVAAAAALVVAVLCAQGGLGRWTLVVQQLTLATVTLGLLVLFAGWLPRKPQRAASVRGFLRFGWTLVATQMVGYAANNTDSLVIGTRLGATPLGLYSRAFQLLMNPLNQLRSPTTSVALPVLSRLHDDPDRQQKFVERGQIALGYTLVVGLGLLIGAAGPVSAVVLGPQWDVANIFALLGVAGVFQTLAFVGYWVYLAEALTFALLRYSLVSAAIKVACVLVGSNWGVLGVAAGYALAPALSWPLSLAWLSRKSSIRVGPLYAGAGRILGVTVLSGAAARLVAWAADGALPDLITLIICCLAWAVAYAGLILASSSVRADVTPLVGTISSVLPGRR